MLHFKGNPNNNYFTYPLDSFHPQMVFLPNLSVYLHACLCGVVNYAAQALDFLDLRQKSSFLDWKHQKVPFIGKGLLCMGTRSVPWFKKKKWKYAT